MTATIEHDADCDTIHTRRQRCNQNAAQQEQARGVSSGDAPRRAASPPVTPAQVYCSSCGTPTFSEAAYCYRCGAPIVLGSRNALDDAVPSSAYVITETVRLRPDPLWDDARGWRAVAWTGVAAAVVGLIIAQSAPVAGVLTLVLGVLAVAGYWVARSETKGWTEDGPSWVALGRVLWIVFRIALVLTIIGWALSRIADRR
jgi:hypothetical protein